jgi:predicted nucleic acid-binding protein
MARRQKQSPRTPRWLFVDTSGLAALLIQEEPPHSTVRQAWEQAQQQGPKWLTHNLVLAEESALLLTRTRLPPAEIAEFLLAIRASQEVQVEYVTPDLEEAALRRLQQFADKRWTLCDTVSFLLMEQHGITDALTTDHHFTQAGFRALLA